ncbi:hypothetical protein THAOC_05783 [Thalassiosira oceanica]|uniref:Uncharacterized protein n=1 Tax=Thalassiosira oceanica TaxID=159749 RepID=K0T218_THAOC|nr:hypothetical protein THAOC_05783 [Thalassiosira oceanica]|eukprot:EJK72663.1 hypothetical protein THAOC_05783 [Thalassiosira oceanica]
MNLLRTSRRDPSKSAYEDLFGQFDYNKTPIAVVGSKALAYDAPTTDAAWTGTQLMVPVRSTSGWICDEDASTNRRGPPVCSTRTTSLSLSSYPSARKGIWKATKQASLLAYWETKAAPAPVVTVRGRPQQPAAASAPPVSTDHDLLRKDPMSRDTATAPPLNHPSGPGLGGQEKDHRA